MRGNAARPSPACTIARCCTVATARTNGYRRYTWGREQGKHKEGGRTRRVAVPRRMMKTRDEGWPWRKRSALGLK